tara:strand:+ start:52 stop:351 length:300 start_codon:yes stop_codon:yes gene_type:complete
MNENELENKILYKGLDAPRLTPDLIDDVIVMTDYHLFSGTCFTVCLLTLKNGFNVVGESACVSPENFDQEIGRNVAYNDARDKIWLLEGYLLKERLSNQ